MLEPSWTFIHPPGIWTAFRARPEAFGRSAPVNQAGDGPHVDMSG